MTNTVFVNSTNISTNIETAELSRLGWMVMEVMLKAEVEVEVGDILRTVTEESYMTFRGWTLVLMIFVTSGGT